MIDKVDKFMQNLKKQNPNVNWENLFTGVAILVMVSVFSYVYFNKAKEEMLTFEEKETVDETALPVTGGNFSTPVSETTVVQKGEGLWHVAQRVCGDGEKYNMIAQANGLMVWEDLNEGMTLKVVCR